METMDYTGLDVHKRKISYCVKDRSTAKDQREGASLEINPALRFN